MTKVYVLSRGELSEGGSIVGVYSDEKAARATALEEQACFEPWKEKSQNNWRSGCDWMSIEIWEVKE